MNEREKISIFDYIEVLVKWRRLILYNLLIVTSLAIIISFLLPNRYTAQATILPPNPQQDILLGAMSTSLPSGLSSLARMGGMGLGLTSPSDLYAALMQSGAIVGNIIRKYNLKKVFKVKTNDDAYKCLDRMTKIIVQPEGIISIAVTYKNKFLATDIANSYVEELDKFNTETAMTTGKKYRIFIEQRLAETVDKLAVTENALRAFQEKHRTVALDAEIESAIQTIAQLKSEIILREVQKGAVSSISNLNNPYVANINLELSQLRRQLSKIEFGSEDTTNREFGAGFSMPFSRLPELSMEYANLLRDVKVQETIYELMIQQYEQAKIMELKDTPTVQFLSKAGIPEKKSFPVRRNIALLGIVIGFMSGICAAFTVEYVNKVKAGRTKYAPKWLAIYKAVHGDISMLWGKLKRLRIFSKWTTKK